MHVKHHIVTREVVELVADRMASGAHKGDLKRLIREVAGKAKISRATYEAVLTRSRALNLRKSVQGKGQFLQDSIEFYQSIVRDDDERTGDRLKAQERLDELIGVAAKFTGSNRASPEESAEEIRALLQAAQDSVSGPPRGGTNNNGKAQSNGSRT